MESRLVLKPKHVLHMVLAVLAGTSYRDAQALTFLVGGDGACDYNTVQAAINGAASNPGPDSVRLANNASYTQQALTIGTQDLIIEGGYANCGSATPTGITTINGAGGAAAPVFRISGSGVRDLGNLTIRGGDSTGANYGGGIQFSGSGELVLRNVGVSNNTSTYGGGIFFSGSGGPAVLTIETNTVILNNTAQQSGGGIYINGDARLFMLRDRTSVQGNTAVSGDGGGIYVGAPALADIASPGYLNNGAIYNNSAVRGGGIAVVSDVNGEARARLFGVDASRPVRVNGNRAASQGGGIWLQSWAGGASFNSVNVCTYDVLIDGNRASDGAAAYADYVSDIFGLTAIAKLGVNALDCNVAAPESILSLGRVACATGVSSCNFIANNVAANSAGVETGGAILKLAADGTLDMQSAIVIGNIGGTAIQGGDFQVDIANSMIIGNSLSGDVIRLGDLVFSLTDSTIAANVNGGATHLIRSDGPSTVRMNNNIIWQPGKLTLLYPGGGQSLSSDEIRYNIVSDVTTLPQGPLNVQSDPQFIDPGTYNFGLRISSPALDFSPPIVGDDRGIDGRPRDQQVRPGPPRALVRDVGALERQRPDPYLPNGTFDSSLRLWTNDFPEFTRWNTLNDGPATVSGSTEMFIPGDQTGEPGGIQIASIYGVKQCFRVPWPGFYSLSARGLTRTDGSVVFPDSAALNWRLRYNSPDCVGPVDIEGDLVLPNNVGWNSPGLPSMITIADASWNFQTTLEISLGVVQNLNDPATQNPLFGRLDNVVLQFDEGAAVLFANGFEN